MSEPSALINFFAFEGNCGIHSAAHMHSCLRAFSEGFLVIEQVQEVETGAWCKTEIAFRPVTSSPQQMYGQLGLHRRGLERRVALAAERFQQAVKQTAAVLDRTNAMGTADCLLVNYYPRMTGCFLHTSALVCISSFFEHAINAPRWLVVRVQLTAYMGRREWSS